MKLNSSPSISTSKLSGILPTPRGSIHGCLSFVFRRILCSRRTLPTHPFDQFNEIDPKLDPSATPNLVARLMGLHSMPSVKDSPQITRSKSANLTDRRFEETGKMEGDHRRVKTSVSFKETPCYFELEDDDFFVIRFGSGRRSSKSRLKSAKYEMGGLDRKKKKDKWGLVEPKVDTENDESANLSPVSVLDHTLFTEELHTTEEEETTRRSASDHNSAKCSKEEDDNKEAAEAIQAGLQRQDYHSHQNIEMLNLICRLAGSEMVNSEWDCQNKMVGNLKMWEVEIGAELGLQMLYQVVDELVNELFLVYSR